MKFFYYLFLMFMSFGFVCAEQFSTASSQSEQIKKVEVPEEKLLQVNEVADNFHAVQEGVLYRSAQLSSDNLENYIKKYGIKTVINLRGRRSRASWWKSENNVCLKNNVELFNVNTGGALLPTKRKLLKLLDFFDTVLTPILIHCLHGINRTGQAAALWILDQMGGTKEKALDQLTEKYGYDEKLVPAKRFFIQEVWQGREWARTKYNPKDYMEEVRLLRNN